MFDFEKDFETFNLHNLTVRSFFFDVKFPKKSLFHLTAKVFFY